MACKPGLSDRRQRTPHRLSSAPDAGGHRKAPPLALRRVRGCGRDSQSVRRYTLKKFSNMQGSESDAVYAVFNKIYAVWYSEDWDAVKAILERFGREQRLVGADQEYLAWSIAQKNREADRSER